ncbi:MAG: hypothetical protein GY940_40450 [bacterium]|nr:hypothetical protein [bacterium]
MTTLNYLYEKSSHRINRILWDGAKVFVFSIEKKEKTITEMLTTINERLATIKKILRTISEILATIPGIGQDFSH